MSLLDAVWGVSFLVYLQRLTVFIGRPALLGWLKPLIIGVASLAVLQPTVSRWVFIVLPEWTSDFDYPVMVAIKLIYFYGTFLVFIVYAAVIWRVHRAIRRVA